MHKLSVVLAFLFSLSLVSGTYLPRAAPGTQFITGPCQSDKDCASGCCGFKSGKCAGPIIAQERDGGCGFGDAQPNNNAAVALVGPNAPGPKPKDSPAPAPAPATPKNSGAGTAPKSGTQFITGPCASDGDCASGCCGFTSGKCAGPIVAQERDGGCGFGNAQPNNNAAVALVGPNAPKATPKAAPSQPAPSPPPPPTPKNPGAGTSPAGQGKQFITGPCTSDADCASGCCGFRTGKCAGPIIAQERDGGCGFGDAQPNDRAAKAFRGT